MPSRTQSSRFGCISTVALGSWLRPTGGLASTVRSFAGSAPRARGLLKPPAIPASVLILFFSGGVFFHRHRYRSVGAAAARACDMRPVRCTCERDGQEDTSHASQIRDKATHEAKQDLHGRVPPATTPQFPCGIHARAQQLYDGARIPLFTPPYTAPLRCAYVHTALESARVCM